MTRSHALQGSLYGFILLLAGASPPSTIPLEVLYAGCEAVLLPGTVCKLPASRELRLWVKTPPDAQIEIGAAGNRIHVAGELIHDGERFSLTIPRGAESVDVLVDAPEGQARWSLRLNVPGDEEPREPLVRPARYETSRDLLGDIDETAWPLFNSIQDRRFAAAREILESLRGPEAPAELRFHVSYFRGLLAEKEGDYRTALTEIQNAIETAERVKLEAYQWEAEEKLATLLAGLGRFREAAELYESLSRTPLAADFCKGAQLLVNQAWSSLLAREVGESVEDPTPLLEKALNMYEHCKGSDSSKRLNVLINLALSHLQEGRLGRAKDFLAQARELEDHATLLHTLWSLDLEARIALQDGRPAEALRWFERLEELAAGTASPDGRLRAAVGQARSHEALGNRTAALEVLRAAEALLDEQSLRIPVHEGRDTFIATRQAIVSLHIDLLLQQGEREEALTVARQARSRMLRQLETGDRLANLPPDKRAAWDRVLKSFQQKRAALEARAKDDENLPLDQRRRARAARAVQVEELNQLSDRLFQLLGESGEQRGAVLSPPRPGELILAYHPTVDGWIGFAADGKNVAVHPFALPLGELRATKELSRHLLLPFSAQIQRAERIRILASGRLLEVDFNELPFAGDVLLAARPLAYGLDLPVDPGSAPAPGRRALLVIDPRDNLPAASEETRAVRGRLGAWSIEELATAQATAEAVRDGLITADLLHYIGHGKFSGFGGWDSSLLLAEESRLTLGDLLALERVPAWVVLSACETGRSSTETPVGTPGLAHAFLLAGSQAVVASIRPAKDREMPRFFSELYQEWGREPDLAVALQRAQLSWRKRNPAADWKAFRVFEP